jgi:acyl carrier protein
MEKLLEILEEIKPGFEFTGRTDLVESGDLDSFDVISLVSELNDAYDIDIPVEAIVPENFNSVEAMMALINEQLED